MAIRAPDGANNKSLQRQRQTPALPSTHLLTDITPYKDNYIFIVWMFDHHLGSASFKLTISAPLRTTNSGRKCEFSFYDILEQQIWRVRVRTDIKSLCHFGSYVQHNLIRPEKGGSLVWTSSNNLSNRLGCAEYGFNIKVHPFNLIQVFVSIDSYPTLDYYIIYL